MVWVTLILYLEGEKLIIMIFPGLTPIESRVDEITFPDIVLSTLRPGFRDTVRVKMCKLYESARVQFQFC